MTTPSSVFRAGSISSSRSSIGRSPEQGAAREAEQQAVADLAGGAGDGDLQGGSAHDVLLVGRAGPMDASSGRVRDDGGHGVGEPARASRSPWRWSSAPAGAAPRRPDSPPSGVDELKIPTPSPDPDDFVRGIDNPWLAARARRAPGATRSPATRRGRSSSPSRTRRTTSREWRPPRCAHRADRRRGRRLLRPGPARQRVVVRPGGRVAGRRGRRRGGPRHAGDAAGGRRLARGVRRGRG